ncbi:MAG: hypothetical protein HFH15_03160 [Ruminococcus sp.]|nr:hypothetical protein [Ruminococcus sp.]
MKQLLQKLRGLLGPGHQENVQAEQTEQFSQSVLDRYRIKIRRLPFQDFLHIKTLSLQTEREPAAITNITNWNVHQIREKETITKLFPKIQNMDVQWKQLQKKIRLDSTRLERLERQIKESVGMEQKILKKIHSHTEREIRSVREETLFYTRKFHRNVQQLELENRKQVQETIQDGFRKELRILRRIQEERQEVLLVYPDIRWYLRQGGLGTEDAAGSKFFLPEHQAQKKNPVLFRQPHAIQEAQDAPVEHEIREMVKEQVQDQAGWLADKIYRRLERQLFDEKKRRGF